MLAGHHINDYAYNAPWVETPANGLAFFNADQYYMMDLLAKGI